MGRPETKADGAEPSRLIGKTIVIAARQISAPRPFGCAAAHYKVSDVTPELLFEGAFDAMRSHDRTVDPTKIAASLGFTGTVIKTLETGCEIDFHFVDATTAEVGLNDYVYTKKQSCGRSERAGVEVELLHDIIGGACQRLGVVHRQRAER